MRDYAATLDQALSIYRSALRGAQPHRLLECIDLDALAGKPLDHFRRVFVAGAGKASIPMAGKLEELLGERLSAGEVVVPHGYPDTLPPGLTVPSTIRITEAGHPVPDRSGAEAADRALRMAAACGPNDLLIVLISGGGSALWPALAGGIRIEDLQQASRQLLRAGADIHEINTVRKHISGIKGGRLAATGIARVLALLISDVVGDHLSVIASGPTVPDPTTFHDAVSVIQRYHLWNDLPVAVRSHLERGLAGREPESPKPGDPVFDRVSTVLLGTNRGSLESAAGHAHELGLDSVVVSDTQTGEARDVARQQVEHVLKEAPSRSTCYLWGGETTVTVRGDGRGGRNQEMALAASLALEGRAEHLLFLSGGTDGIDGPTDAAGAWSTPLTAAAAREVGLDPETFLANNDAYTFFDRVGQLLRTGPTHTNVMDVQLVVCHPD